ncbi:dienelactone hydrolase [Pelagibius litoralis]|uniref:Dienelactone hydrolase n=1 Tax=Pelagibius litoralis TaxID=374515 RepID=A0A967F1F2_9PROT|nr:dienelactone hydrolase family protein [Pelagibius litoralis]NIA71222.1 dienelactone hydrolase [Pelagibius litoralis]
MLTNVRLPNEKRPFGQRPLWRDLILFRISGRQGIIFGMMVYQSIRSGLLTGFLSVLSTCAAFATEAVQFKGANDQTLLTGFLSVPTGSNKVPAVVFLHGCSGLGGAGQIYATYTAWARYLNDAGYAVLMIDSAGPRGFRATCGPSEARRVMYRERPGDAYAALAFLQSSSRIDPARISLMGWSQGGGITLLTIVSKSIGRPIPPPAHDFRAAIALYPSACSDRLQSRPSTDVEPGSWSPVAPLLVLQGDADNWTKPRPCIVFIEAARNRGEPVEIIVYPDAVHSFDAPDMPLRERLGATTADGEAPLVGTNEAARSDAFARVLRFLKDNASTK